MNDDIDDEGTDPGVGADDTGFSGDTVSLGGDPDAGALGDSLGGDTVLGFAGDTVSLAGEAIFALAGFDDEERTDPGDNHEGTDPGTETA